MVTMHFAGERRHFRFRFFTFTLALLFVLFIYKIYCPCIVLVFKRAVIRVSENVIHHTVRNNGMPDFTAAKTRNEVIRTIIDLSRINVTKEEVDETHKNVWMRRIKTKEYPIPAFNNKYKLNNENICSDSKNVSYIMIVHTATEHFNQRNLIRETWGQRKLNIRIVFVLGETANNHTQDMLNFECKQNKDMVQGNFLDSYHNLTHKAVLGLRWVSEYCAHARYVVKVDDDVFLNVFRISEFLGTGITPRKNIWCELRDVGYSRIQRDDRWKWKVEEDDFKNFTFFPFSHCTGGFVIYTSDLVQDLFIASNIVPFFWIDDVYVTGMLTEVLGHVQKENLLYDNLIKFEIKPAIRCFEQTEKKCRALAAYTKSTLEKMQLWHMTVVQEIKLSKNLHLTEVFKNL